MKLSTLNPTSDLGRVRAVTARYVDQLLQRFCDDPADRNCGGFVDPATAYADARNSIMQASDRGVVYTSGTTLAADTVVGAGEGGSGAAHAGNR